MSVKTHPKEMIARRWEKEKGVQIKGSIKQVDGQSHAYLEVNKVPYLAKGKSNMEAFNNVFQLIKI